jgi:hypothetical protein
MRLLPSIALAVAVVLVGCGGGDSVDVSGSYTVAVTNGANGCMAVNWTVGDSNPGIPVTIAQDGSNVTATVEGLTGTYLQAGLGSRVFAGDVSGHSLSLELIGTTPQTQGSCTFTYNALLDGDIDGDVIMGTITYTGVSQDTANCSAIIGCESVQDFNGTRPPSS